MQWLGKEQLGATKANAADRNLSSENRTTMRAVATNTTNTTNTKEN
jgi:hypothetical protein